MKSVLWRYYAFNAFWNILFVAPVIVPFFTQWGHINLFQVQLLQSWYSLWCLLFEVPTGILADKIGRKYTMSAGAFITALACLAYGSVPNFIVFLAAEFIFALGISLISGADQALLYELLQENGRENESVRYFGRSNSFQLVGIIIGSLLGSLIANYFGLRIPFLLSAIPVAVAGFIALSLREPKSHKKLEKESVFTNFKNGYAYLLQHKTLRLLAFDSIIVYTVAYFVLWLWQPFLQKIGIAILYFGLFQTVFTVGEIFVSNHFTNLEKIVGSAKNYFRFSALATALSFILVALFPNLVTILLFVLLAGSVGLSRKIAMSAYMNKFISSDKRATVLSSVSTFESLFVTIANPIIGLLALHSIQLAALLLGIIPLAVFFFSPLEQKMLD